MEGKGWTGVLAKGGSARWGGEGRKGRMLHGCWEKVKGRELEMAYYYWLWMLGSVEDSINVLEGFWKGYGTRSS